MASLEVWNDRGNVGAWLRHTRAVILGL